MGFAFSHFKETLLKTLFQKCLPGNFSNFSRIVILKLLQLLLLHSCRNWFIHLNFEKNSILHSSKKSSLCDTLKIKNTDTNLYGCSFHTSALKISFRMLVKLPWNFCKEVFSGKVVTFAVAFALNMLGGGC